MKIQTLIQIKMTVVKLQQKGTNNESTNFMDDFIFWCNFHNY